MATTDPSVAVMNIDEAGPSSSCEDHGQRVSSSSSTSSSTPRTTAFSGDSASRRDESVKVLAEGIASIMGPAMNNFDARVEGALKSQGILASSIDRLTRELDKLLEDAPLPFAAEHASRLSGIRKRAASLSTSIRIIQKRITNIERLLAGYASKRLVEGKLVNSSLPEMEGLQSTPSWSSYQPEAPLMEGPSDSNESETFLQDAENVPYTEESTGLQSMSENLMVIEAPVIEATSCSSVFGHNGSSLIEVPVAERPSDSNAADLVNQADPNANGLQSTEVSPLVEVLLTKGMSSSKADNLDSGTLSCSTPSEVVSQDIISIEYGEPDNKSGARIRQ